MRILFISNLYPPHHMGGYELGCRDIAEGLRARGHDVHVLTSTYGLRRPGRDGRVSRTLYPDPAWPLPQPARALLAGAGAAGRVVPGVTTAAEALWLLRKEAHNQGEFRRLVRRMSPDVVYAWNVAGISVSLLFLARSLGLPSCACVSDHWLAGWEDDLWYGSLTRARAGIRRLDPRRHLGVARTILDGGAALPLSRVQFVSDALKREAVAAGLAVQDADVIHWGVDVDKFEPVARDGRPPRLLYVGQVVRHKGVHTVIDALPLLPPDVTLTVVGGTTEPGYLDELRDRVAAHGLGDRVTFTGPVPREEVPRAHREHDILVLPSIWEEPFSIGLLEAMASGLPVAATLTGGTGEILQSGHNGLAFEPANAESCAQALRALLEDPALRTRLGNAARETVARRFDLAGMIDRVERSLTETVERARRGGPHHPLPS